jgi:predicted TPR repeat methyltransferase
LDLGCGAGHLLQALRDAGYGDLRGVDISPEAVAIARSKGFDVTQADLRDYLCGATEAFDLITAFDVIEHFGKDEVLEVLCLVRERLEPGGY